MQQKGKDEEAGKLFAQAIELCPVDDAAATNTPKSYGGKAMAEMRLPTCKRPCASAAAIRSW